MKNSFRRRCPDLFKQLIMRTRVAAEYSYAISGNSFSFALIIIAVFASFFPKAGFGAVEINYVYDDLNRLKSMSRADGPVAQYTYDEVGNFEDRAVSQSPDTDGDQIADFVDSDDDGDGISDSWELQYGLDPLDPSDAALDPDGDGIDNLAEYQGGTDPNQYNNSTPVPFLPAWAGLLLAAMLSALLLRLSNKQGV